MLRNVDRAVDLNQGGSYTKSVVPFLKRLIDYAGLFPPASLTLDQAIKNYKEYSIGTDAWMLGPFVMPASKIDQLDPYVELFSTDTPLNISALGSKSDHPHKFNEVLLQDLAKLESFSSRHGERVKMRVFEAPLPIVTPLEEILDILSEETAKRGLDTFCEALVPLRNNDWEQQITYALDQIYKHNSQLKPALGFKFRTGGVTAELFPTPRQLAAVLVGCRDRGMAMKFTAGLHHPVRMYREEVSTRMHGFLNIFTAGMLAYKYNLDIRVTEEILKDENPSHFTFTNEGLSWQDKMISVSEISELRNKFLCSYGSCSFDEPREDLRALKVL
ncbi:hypothetical protein J2S00_003867 [Caldalkalibacillus uzonensis]|uniref:Uncharacterized protein n=1 Tax=Caldalkalibacillus uzonensis TaxID=353224 RepID=A0ABU0CY06_9BACI|nr:hypothetical protein [Caldalkalibacillus uzonensis]MDQ0341023.1 hypothetical protein [Caldalkalibacillus uzonensis]